MNKIVVVYGPKGCGKTRNTEALQTHFGADVVHDIELTMSCMSRYGDELNNLNARKILILTNNLKVAYHIKQNHDAQLFTFGKFAFNQSPEKQYITPEFIQGIIDNPGTMGPAIVQLCKKYQALSLDAARYRFLRDKDLFGADNDPELKSWDELVELDCAEFDEAIDDRMRNAI